MRSASLILVDPNGKVKRLVVTAEDVVTDEGMVGSLCRAMMDREFMSNLVEVSELEKRQLKEIWGNG